MIATASYLSFTSIRATGSATTPCTYTILKNWLFLRLTCYYHQITYFSTFHKKWDYRNQKVRANLMVKVSNRIEWQEEGINDKKIETFQTAPLFLLPPVWLCCPCFCFGLQSARAALQNTLYIVTEKSVIVSVAGNL